MQIQSLVAVATVLDMHDCISAASAAADVCSKLALLVGPINRAFGSASIETVALCRTDLEDVCFRSTTQCITTRCTAIAYNYFCILQLLVSVLYNS
jgi:hypothetical protein